MKIVMVEISEKEHTKIKKLAKMEGKFLKQKAKELLKESLAKC